MVRASLLNNNANINWIAKRDPICIRCLPGAFVDTFGERCSEQDLNSRLCPCAGGIECDLFGRAKVRSANVFQAVIRIPVTSAAIFNLPLLIESQAKSS